MSRDQYVRGGFVVCLREKPVRRLPVLGHGNHLVVNTSANDGDDGAETESDAHVSLPASSIVSHDQCAYVGVFRSFKSGFSKENFRRRTLDSLTLGGFFFTLDTSR